MRADRFEPLPSETLAHWEGFPNWPEHAIFPMVVGLAVEEIRTDYCRMRLPYRPDLRQPAGVVHGGAIATLIDTVVVPALAWPYDHVPKLLTITLNIRFRGALIEEDGVAEGWIDTRGRSTAFCGAEVVGADSGMGDRLRQRPAVPGRRHAGGSQQAGHRQHRPTVSVRRAAPKETLMVR